MDFKNKSEQKIAQELELANAFQMEELEERFELDGTAKGWFANDVVVVAGPGGSPQGHGTVTGGTLQVGF